MRLDRTPLALVAALTSLIAVPALAAQAHKADPLNDKLMAHVAATDAKLATAAKAKRVTPAQAAEMRKKIAWVRMDSAKYVKQQGFLSGAESASYTRSLDEIDAKLSK